ncbi:MAG TPA: ATPase, T2SS/T4P/T4SS family [Nitrospinota bacterium]|nr:ATPase, T2SS/T4P/T4SS family [Nitrospinota bacterium]
MDSKISNEKLKEVTNKINSTSNIDKIIVDLKNDIAPLFKAEKVTIYAVDPVMQELFSKILDAGEIKEVRVPISNASIAGYAAYNLKVLNIQDVYDETELKKIGPNLKFNKKWDRNLLEESGFSTKQVLCAPICFKDRIFGVIQIINKIGGKAFANEDEKTIQEIASTLGIAFRNNAKNPHARFNQLIIQNLIKEEELKKATLHARQKKTDIESVLMEIYKVSKTDLGMCLGQFYGCKFVEYDDTVRLQDELFEGLSLVYMRKMVWIPIAASNGKLTILTDNPNDLKTGEIERLLKGKEFSFQIALKEDILKYIDLVERGYHTKSGMLNSIMTALGKEVVEEPEEETVIKTKQDVKETSNALIRLVDMIIIDAYKDGASDIHVEPDKVNKTVFVRFRIDGSCINYCELPIRYGSAILSRIKIMANLDIAEKRLPQDGKIVFFYNKKPIELRVATLPTVGAEDAVMRILATSSLFPLEELNLYDWNKKSFGKMISKPYGIILVVGPTGSGKTTTLHSALGHINTPEKKIWTAEDPVEITQKGLRQVEIKSKIDFTFARAMRSFLRADPDVIMVGEMRDFETSSIAIEASLTGHLVFSTLHTNSAPETVTRLIDIGLDPFSFADALLGVLAQRLVRNLCSACKEEYHPDKEEFEYLVGQFGGDDFAKLGIEYNSQLLLCKATGCEKCLDTGYKGRTGLHEVLVGTDAIKHLVQKKAPIEEITKQAKKDGMTTIYQDGIRKIFKGYTDLIQVKKVCMDVSLAS